MLRENLLSVLHAMQVRIDKNNVHHFVIRPNSTNFVAYYILGTQE